MSRPLEQIAKELVRAAGQNRAEVWQLLEEYEAAGGGPAVAAADGEGNTAVLAAGLRGHEGLVEALLGRGASWEQRNAAGNCLLHQLVARPGAQPRPFPASLVSAVNRHGETALCKAARQGNSAWVAALLAAGAQVRSLPAQPAVLPLLLPLAPPALVRALVLAGPGPAALLAWPYLAPEPQLLHALPSPAVLPLALARADLALRDAGGRTCLDHALAAASLPHVHAYAAAPHTPHTAALAAPLLARLLLSPEYHLTALALLPAPPHPPPPGLALAAARANAVDVLAALLGEGKAGEEGVEGGEELMRAASEAGAVEAAVLLVGRGVRLQGGRAGGWSLLHRAAALGLPGPTAALLGAGAEVGAGHAAPDAFEEGGTALHLAAGGPGPGHAQVLALLLAARAPLDSQAHARAWTPLHAAAAARAPAALASLLAAGARADLRDTDGLTARDLAPDLWP